MRCGAVWRGLGVQGGAVRVETIAGWALRLAVHYPTLSGISFTSPTEKQHYAELYDAAISALDRRHLRNMVTATYKRIYVDEYQDCTARQHGLLLRLADLAPTSVLGDPLQGIFGWSKDPLVEWNTHVLPHFPTLTVESRPHRWKNTNPALGKWLLSVRERLIERRPIELSGAPVDWRYNSDQARTSVCLAALGGNDSVVALMDHANRCHHQAKKLRGHYRSMEELEARDLRKHASAIDAATGNALAAALVDTAKACATGMPTSITNAGRQYAGGTRPTAQAGSQWAPVYRSLDAVADGGQPVDILAAADVLEASLSAHGGFFHRRECWREFRRALRIQREEGGSLAAAALAARDGARHVGRPLELRVISRPALVKGLEYDHAILLDADAYNATELYVALTRGAQRLSVLSASSTITPKGW